MNNSEIDTYLVEWRNQMSKSKSKVGQVLGAVVGIVVMLAEIAKRLPMKETQKLIASGNEPKRECFICKKWVTAGEWEYKKFNKRKQFIACHSCIKIHLDDTNDI